MLPSSLRAQVALVGLLACLLIPIGTSSLRGLTHILTCQEESATDFTIAVDDQGLATLGGSTVIEPGDTPNEEPTLCGGLRLDIALAQEEPGEAEMTLTIINDTEYGWRGSVQLDLGTTPIPIDIGDIDSGSSGTDEVTINLDRDSSYEIEGSLLIGP